MGAACACFPVDTKSPWARVPVGSHLLRTKETDRPSPPNSAFDTFTGEKLRGRRRTLLYVRLSAGLGCLIVVLSRPAGGLVEGFKSGSPNKSLSLVSSAWISPAAAVEGMMAKLEVWPGRIRCRRRLSLMLWTEGISRIALVLDPTMSQSATTGMPTRCRIVILLSIREGPKFLRSRRSNQRVK